MTILITINRNCEVNVMAVSVKINSDLVRRLNTLVEEKVYTSREEALEEAIRFLVVIKKGLWSASEIRTILSRYITVPSDEILYDIKEEEDP